MNQGVIIESLYVIHYELFYDWQILVITMDKQTGCLINLFNFSKPITDMYCGQLTIERAWFLLLSIYESSCLPVHGFNPISCGERARGE